MIELRQQAASPLSPADSEVVSTLHAAARHGDLGAIERIVHEHPNINIDATDDQLLRPFGSQPLPVQGRAAVHWAAEAGDLQVLRFLVEEANASIGTADNDGDTPLTLAALNSHLECVKLLLDRDAVVDEDVLPLLGALPVGRALIDNLFRGHLCFHKSFLQTMGLFLAFLDHTVQSRTALNNYVIKTVELDLYATASDASPVDPQAPDQGNTPFSRVLQHPVDWVHFLPALLKWQVALQTLSQASVSEAADLGDALCRRLDEVIAALFDSECMDHEVVVLQQLLLLHPQFLPSSLRFASSPAASTKSPPMDATALSNDAAAATGAAPTASAKVWGRAAGLSLRARGDAIDAAMHVPDAPPASAPSALGGDSGAAPPVPLADSATSPPPSSTGATHTPPSLQQLTRGDLAWLDRPPALYAACLADGSLLHFALQHRLKVLFEMTQVSAIVDKVFRRNARLPLDNERLPRRRVFRWLLTLRFSPRNFLLLELFSQVAMLALMWNVAVGYGHRCQDVYLQHCDDARRWSRGEVALSVYVFTELCYEAGLTLAGREHALGRWQTWRDALMLRFRDDLWNLVDATSVLGGVAWFACRCLSPRYFVAARVLLSLLAIPQSLGMLRYFSLFKSLGELVIIIRAMTKDLVAFLVVYLVFILGFGIAFRGLFYTSSAYDSNSNAFLSLFDITLMSYDYSVFDADSAFINGLGVALTVVCTAGTAILLLNLLIAQMWETYERIRSQSLREWSFHYALLVQRLSLWREKNVFCMLPSPLNLLPILVTCGGLVTIVRLAGDDDDRAAAAEGHHVRNPLGNGDAAHAHAEERSADCGRYVSIGGTAANCLLAYICYPYAVCHRMYSVLVAPFAAAAEASSTSQKPRRRRSRHRVKRVHRRFSGAGASRAAAAHPTRRRNGPGGSDAAEHYQRHTSDDDDDEAHGGGSADEEEAEDDDNDHIHVHFRPTAFGQWLEKLLQPPPFRDRQGSLTVGEKVYFLCVTAPLLLVLWPAAPFVAAQLAHYPLLELLDSKDAIFLPPEYLKSAALWQRDMHETGRKRHLQRRHSREWTWPVLGWIRRSYGADSAATKSRAKRSASVSSPKATGPLRHVESSAQMLAERDRRAMSISSPLNGPGTVSSSLPPTRKQQQDSEVGLSYFVQEDVDRILLPLIRNPAAVDLDVLAKKSLVNESQRNTKDVDGRLAAIESALASLASEGAKRDEVLHALLAALTARPST